METSFYISAAVAIVATLMVITQRNAVHALLYLIVSLLAVAVIFFLLGAPFVAALEIIVYAGAIMVLFVFAIMILNLGPQAVEQERSWTRPVSWLGPCVLATILLAQLATTLALSSRELTGGEYEPAEVARSLFGPYALGVELAALILLSGLVGAYHLARRRTPEEEGKR